jgi:hypothetical protein
MALREQLVLWAVPVQLVLTALREQPVPWAVPVRLVPWALQEIQALMALWAQLGQLEP